MRSLVLTAVLLLVVPASARAAAGDIIVKRAPGLDRAERAELRADAGVELVEALPLRRTELVRSADPARSLAVLRADDDVVYAEPDRPVTAAMAMDDTFFGALWALHNTGQNVFGQLGTAGADIAATSAWDTTRGAGVTVAVVDTGINAAHVDLVDQLAVNAAEAAGLPGVDDDHNGYVDDARGWDFVDNDDVPQDDHGHGTHVSGTIAARGQNASGVAGVAPEARVLALRALNSAGTGWMSTIATAFAYAGDAGVRIVNASLGGPYSRVMEAAVAAHPGTLYVVAAGNDGADADATAYPCALPEPNLICVGASDNRDEPASFSNFGATAVDLFAPGVGIYSTSNTSPTAYRYLDGTSMAAPHVAGAAALALSVHPAASTAYLRSALLSSVDARPDLTGRAVTGGRLNANGAVAAILPPEPTPAPTPEAPVATPPPVAPMPPPVAPIATPVATATPRPEAAMSALRLSGSLRGRTGRLEVSFRLARSVSVRYSIRAKGAGTVLARWTRAGRAGANAMTFRRRLPTGRTLGRGDYTLSVAAGPAAPSTRALRVT